MLDASMSRDPDHSFSLADARKKKKSHEEESKENIAQLRSIQAQLHRSTAPWALPEPHQGPLRFVPDFRCKKKAPAQPEPLHPSECFHARLVSPVSKILIRQLVARAAPRRFTPPTLLYRSYSRMSAPNPGKCLSDPVNG